MLGSWHRDSWQLNPRGVWGSPVVLTGHQGQRVPAPQGDRAAPHGEDPCPTVFGRRGHWQSLRQPDNPQHSLTQDTCFLSLHCKRNLSHRASHKGLWEPHSLECGPTNVGPKSMKRRVSQSASCCIHHNTQTQLSTVIPRCGRDVKLSHWRWAVFERRV